MRDLPTGTVTFLFTDIEGSTRLLERLGDRYARRSRPARRILRAAIAAARRRRGRHRGRLVLRRVRERDRRRRGRGRGPARARRPQPGRTEQRCGSGWACTRGEGVLGGDDYVGLDVNRAARIAAAGARRPGARSRATTRAWSSAASRRERRCATSGEHRLKDLPEPERLYQLVRRGTRAASSRRFARSTRARTTCRPSSPGSSAGSGRWQQIRELLTATPAASP